MSEPIDASLLEELLVGPPVRFREAARRFPQLKAKVTAEAASYVDRNIAAGLPYCLMLIVTVPLIYMAQGHPLLRLLATGHAVVAVLMGLALLARGRANRLRACTYAIMFVGTAFYAVNAYKGYHGREPAIAMRAALALNIVAALACAGAPFESPRRAAATSGLLWILCTVAVSRLDEAASVMALSAVSVTLITATRQISAASYCEIAFLRLITAYNAERMSRDLELGKAVQTLLMPVDRVVRSGRWEIGILFRPHGELSGDWFQIHQDEAGAGIVAIGDVVGKGTSAALNTATIAGLWTHLVNARSGPHAGDAIAHALNRNIFEVFRGRQNTTMSCAVLDDGGLSLLAVAAPPWTRVRRDAKPERIRLRPANPLGLVPATEVPAPARYDAVSGDVFVAFTDGFLDGGEAYRNFLDRSTGLAEIADFRELLAGVDERATLAGSKSRIPDDRTALILRYL